MDDLDAGKDIKEENAFIEIFSGHLVSFICHICVIC